MLINRITKRRRITRVSRPLIFLLGLLFLLLSFSSLIKYHLPVFRSFLKGAILLTCIIAAAASLNLRTYKPQAAGHKPQAKQKLELVACDLKRDCKEPIKPEACRLKLGFYFFFFFKSSPNPLITSFAASASSLPNAFSSSSSTVFSIAFLINFSHLG